MEWQLKSEALDEVCPIKTENGLHNWLGLHCHSGDQRSSRHTTVLSTANEAKHKYVCAHVRKASVSLTILIKWFKEMIWEQD